MIHPGVAAPMRAGSARQLVPTDVGGNLGAVTPPVRAALQDPEPSDPWATVMYRVGRGLRFLFVSMR